MPKPPPPSANQTPSPALQRAALALQMGQFAEAERIAAEVLKASRTDVGAASLLARALLAQNRAAEAVAPLERAVRRIEDPGLETLLGAALGGAGRGSEAIELLRRTTARRPPFLPAFQELAGQLSKAGRGDEAIAVIESALGFAPDVVALQLDLARLLLQRGERGPARAILEMARAAAPDHPDILTVLARVLLLDGDYAAAADLYRRVLAQRPGDVATRADFSACLLEMGERETGEANLRQAMRGRPQMIGRATYALAQSSHGRFFLRPSALAKFLSEPG
ncbi:tetratricopeptide repeat protein [Bradyrhizobium tropiciagri]|uniref:tetratricopeptide repeat protein n=1 Tax=Bradyrhizobium tropiciagri TaxID=312253 RepID=UPI001BA64FA7|nr:tetratricopeptide repeat protein [Bradyrhizobium tropiciagri]MBR0873611.1 tetratricopeptide repeat protein [Bradyrhizobium tropiciagri]